MSDRRLRGLERATATGDLEAEAALLRDHLRSGVMTRKEVGLLAFCGYKAAAIVAELDPDGCHYCLRPTGFLHLPENCVRFDGWFQSLGQFGPDAMKIAADAGSDSLSGQALWDWYPIAYRAICKALIAWALGEDEK